MRSGHSTWRPLFRTIERSWPLKTLPHRFSPPPLDIQWVGQVRNEPHCNSVLFHILSTPRLSVSPSHSCFITFGYFPPMPSSLFPHNPPPPLRFSLSSSFKTHLSKPFSSPTPPLSPLQAHAHWWISNDGPRLFFKHFLHFLLPHSSYFVHLLFFFFFFFLKPHPSMQLLSYEYKQPFKWQLQGVCLCVCLHELIHQHLRDPTNKQQLSDVSTALLSACDE